MSAFGGVPRASVCPCARCVEAITSRSSSARQTPTATASWPIATCRKPGSSPARKRSSTFSSKRLIRSISRRNVRRRCSLNVPFFSTLATPMSVVAIYAQPMSLVEQWRAIEQSLPEGWGDVRLRLTVPDEGDCDRAAALLAPANPGRRGKVISFFAARRGAGVSPGRIRGLLVRLDRERIEGELEAVGIGEEPVLPPPPRRAFAEGWDAELAALPDDWTDLYAEVELYSSDYLERAALLLAPVNPARDDGRAAFRFRCARSFGYGASPEMTRRCLARLDEERIRGSVQILIALSDTHPVQTQGPVWYIGGRSV